MLLCAVLTGCGRGEVQEPVFEKSEKGVVFAAYAAPTVNGKVNEKLDDAYRKLSEAGFTKAIALYEGNSPETGEDTYDTIRKKSEGRSASRWRRWRWHRSTMSNTGCATGLSTVWDTIMRI